MSEISLNLILANKRLIETLLLDKIRWSKKGVETFSNTYLMRKYKMSLDMANHVIKVLKDSTYPENMSKID